MVSKIDTAAVPATAGKIGPPGTAEIARRLDAGPGAAGVNFNATPFMQ
jgi:hypothetical protein